MTAKELIDELLKLPPDMEVIVGSEWLSPAKACLVRMFWFGGSEDSKECVLIESQWNREERK